MTWPEGFPSDTPGRTALIPSGKAGRGLTAGAVVGPAVQDHALLGTGPGILQEDRTRAPLPRGTRAQRPFTQGHERLRVHQRVAAGKHRGALQKLALLPRALQERDGPG